MEKSFLHGILLDCAPPRDDLSNRQNIGYINALNSAFDLAISIVKTMLQTLPEML